MNELTRILLAILTTYRLATLLAWDDGPFDILLRIRQFFGKHAHASPLAKSAADLIHCPYCMSIWIALPITLLVVFPSVPTDALLVFGSLTGASAALIAWTDRTET